MWLYAKIAVDAGSTHKQVASSWRSCLLATVFEATNGLLSSFIGLGLIATLLHFRMALFVMCSCIECHHAPVARATDEGSVLSVVNMLTAIVTTHSCTWYMKIQIQRLPDCFMSQKPYAQCLSLFGVKTDKCVTLPAEICSSCGWLHGRHNCRPVD